MTKAGAELVMLIGVLVCTFTDKKEKTATRDNTGGGLSFNHP
jgi:hypothetical protein